MLLGQFVLRTWQLVQMLMFGNLKLRLPFAIISFAKRLAHVKT